MSMELPELLNADDLAAYLHVPKSFVYRLTHERRIGYVKIGKELRFRRADIADWLEKSSVPVGGTPRRAGRPRKERF